MTGSKRRWWVIGGLIGATMGCATTGQGAGGYAAALSGRGDAPRAVAPDIARGPLSFPLPSAVPAPWAVPWPWAPPSRAPKGEAPLAPGASVAVAYAFSTLGRPYCWGGSGPACYDCSGLTSASWKAGGRAIPRTSEAQARALPGVPLDRALPGDILWRPGHVALYVGDGRVIQAPHTGDVVKLSPAVRFVKALRP